MALRFAVHAYAWTSSSSNDDLWIVDHAAELGLDALEVPLMEPDLIDSPALRGGADAAGIGLLTSRALPEGADPAAENPEERRHARDLLLRGVDLTADMGATVFTGVLYSAIGKRIDRRPCDDDYPRAARCCETLRVTQPRAASRSGSSQSTATRPASLTQPPKRTAYAASWVSRTSAFISTRTT
jgi:D-psicose/D-tagatose/L-ribulose 3-epimerase